MKKTLRWMMTITLTILLIAVFWAAIVLGQPEQQADVQEEKQPLLNDIPEGRFEASADLNSLLESFPAAVLSYPEGMDAVLTEGESRTVPFEDGKANVIRLNYLFDGRIPVTVETIYPARAVSLISKGAFELKEGSARPVAGLSAAEMTDGTYLRWHAKSQQALYTVTVPVRSDAETVLQALQLRYADGEHSPGR